MLNKISNIESAKGYKSSNNKLRSTGYEKILHSYTATEDAPLDSVQFSPATVFLSSVNWDSVELHYESSNDLILSFAISNINFTIELNFVDFYKTSHQKVLLKRKFSKYGKQKIQSITLLVKKPEIKIFDKYPKFEIPGIKRLFYKITNLNLEGQYSRNDIFTINELLDGIDDLIYEDFVNIFYVIYSFIAKLGKYGLTKSTVFPASNKNKIAIEKITVRNA